MKTVGAGESTHSRTVGPPGSAERLAAFDYLLAQSAALPPHPSPPLTQPASTGEEKDDAITAEDVIDDDGAGDHGPSDRGRAGEEDSTHIGLSLSSVPVRPPSPSTPSRHITSPPPPLSVTAVRSLSLSGRSSTQRAAAARATSRLASQSPPPRRERGVSDIEMALIETILEMPTIPTKLLKRLSQPAHDLLLQLWDEQHNVDATPAVPPPSVSMAPSVRIARRPVVQAPPPPAQSVRLVDAVDEAVPTFSSHRQPQSVPIRSSAQPRVPPELPWLPSDNDAAYDYDSEADADNSVQHRLGFHPAAPTSLPVRSAPTIVPPSTRAQLSTSPVFLGQSHSLPPEVTSALLGLGVPDGLAGDDMHSQLNTLVGPSPFSSWWDSHRPPNDARAGYEGQVLAILLDSQHSPALLRELVARRLFTLYYVAQGVPWGQAEALLPLSNVTGVNARQQQAMAQYGRQHQPAPYTREANRTYTTSGSSRPRPPPYSAHSSSSSMMGGGPYNPYPAYPPGGRPAGNRRAGSRPAHGAGQPAPRRQRSNSRGARARQQRGGASGAEEQ